MTISELVDFRKDLHRNPEISLHEHRTRQKIEQALKEIGVENIQTVGGTGMLAVFEGKDRGSLVLLRSDHDALPIHEEGDPPYRSQISGVGHMCGHDGHTAIMLGVASYFKGNPPKKGKLALLFQPAEENGRGAAKVLNDPNFTFNADMAFALHNLPGEKMHQVLCREGTFTPAVKSVIFQLKGKTSHAAEPENGKNPGPAMADILKLSTDLNQIDGDAENFRVISPIYATLGEKAYGISAGYAECHFTIRTWTNSELTRVCDEFLEGTKKICEDHDLGLEWEWLEEFAANENSREAYDLIRQTAREEGLDFKEMSSGRKWGEDFGLITQKFSGAMFGIGSGKDCPALHNPDYDFPDEIIETGIKMFTGIAERALR